MTEYMRRFDRDTTALGIATELEARGGTVIESLVRPELMDLVREEVRSDLAAGAERGSSALWPEGNQTAGGLAAVSPTFVEELLTHPTVL